MLPLKRLFEVTVASTYEVLLDLDDVPAVLPEAALFAVRAQKALHEAAWPPELARHYARVDDPSEPKRIRGLRVRMGMHSGPLKRIRIPSEGLADYYGESANRAAREARTRARAISVETSSHARWFARRHSTRRARASRRASRRRLGFPA